jgi:pyruvate,orthophosphate dikinase
MDPMRGGRQSRLSHRFVHPFDSGIDSSCVLGGKGASLARMSSLGLPTPPGFTIGTDAWRCAARRGEMPAAILEEVEACVTVLEERLERHFGDPEAPLLVSVRSGAPISMPGMMDTVLNLGTTGEVAEALAERVDRQFGWSVYQRLLSQFASVVRGLPDEALPPPEEDPQRGCEALLAALASGEEPFPEDPRKQLVEAIAAVWRSWEGKRARRYRRFVGISDELGTAVTVQAMVFGNFDDRSGTGVVFTRDPATGSPGAYGDFLARAQGEDVVDGSHQTEPLEGLRAIAPPAYADLERSLAVVETAYRDMCDIEFTVESGKLWILQARVGQRSGAAAVRIAVDLVEEGLIRVEEALARIPVAALAQLQAPVLAREQELDVLAEGTPAAPGTARGRAVFDAERAQELADADEDAILIRPETSPGDIAGVIAARGIVTALGGRTSHAAVVAVGIGRPAVCGVETLTVDVEAGSATFGDRLVEDGDLVTIDGGSGMVIAGSARTVPAQPESRAAQVLAWCDEHRCVDIAATAPPEYVVARSAEELAGPRVLIELDWAGGNSQENLEKVVAAAIGQGVERMALRLPDGLNQGDLKPPAAPWTLLVAPPESWPARLLATRMKPSAGIDS